jgi:hypothetical protein
LECRERRSEESVDSDESVESENCWIWNWIEEESA